MVGAGAGGDQIDTLLDRVDTAGDAVDVRPSAGGDVEQPRVGTVDGVPDDAPRDISAESLLVSRPSWRKRLLALLLVLILTTLYAGIRMQDLDRVVTTDEPFWLGRSANFYQALRSDTLEYTYQMAHPGITTMWAGAIAFHLKAPEYATLFPQQISNIYRVDRALSDVGIDPLEMMVAAKQAKVVMQSAFFLISLVYLMLLFRWRIAAIAGGLILFDPFLSGLDSALHVDGMFAMTGFAAVLSLGYAVRAGHTQSLPWVLAGMLAACAWYTRATGVVLVIVLLVVVTVSALKRTRHRGNNSVRSVLHAPAFSGLLWAFGALVASIALLPALWVDPFGTLGQMWDWAREAGREGHEHPTFFRGEIYLGDPGALFYPVTLLWRLTPVTLLGLALFVALMWRSGQRQRFSRRTWMALSVPVLFAALYLLGMTAGAKKFDRYILPVYPVLDLLAAIGFVVAAGMLARSRLRFGNVIAVAAVAVLLLGQALATWSVMPYRLDFYNPLLGGPQAAVEEMQMGWGQGIDQVAAYLGNEVDASDVVTLQSSSNAGMFSYFLPPQVQFERFPMFTPAGWYETDYFAASIQQIQRDLSPEYLLLAGYDPVFTADVVGLDFFRVYTPNRLPLPQELRQMTSCGIDVGKSVRLMQVIERDGSLDLYWLSKSENAPQLIVQLSQIGPGGLQLGTGQGTLLTPGAEGFMSKVNVGLPPPASGLEPGDTDIGIVVSDGTSGAMLLATRLHQACFFDEAVEVVVSNQ